MYIKDFQFEKNKFDRNEFESLNFTKGENWPVVYIINNSEEAYIGQTNSFRRRMKEHLDNPNRKQLCFAHCIVDEDYNKSAVLDIEARLIGYFDADKKFKILNNIGGSISNEYYQRTQYTNKVPVIWERLRKKGLAIQSIFEIENSDLFKYSPYKSLTLDQHYIAQNVFADIETKEFSISFVEGNPGTGKTILAMYLLKQIKTDYPKKKIALVVPMGSLRKTLKKVAGSINGLKKKDVISPNECTKDKWDVLIVDEAHRLKKRKNITNFKAFDDINKKLGLEKGNQLDWIMMCSYHQVFFYDEEQSIKPTDISKECFKDLKQNINNEKRWASYNLENQHRVKGGAEYIQYSKKILKNEKPTKIDFKNYDAKIINSFLKFNEMLYIKEKEFSLCRMVSGYSFEWVSKKDINTFDITIDKIEKQWNRNDKDWINSQNSLNEVGCIHTIQGYDLNYVFLIFGKEIDYDIEKDLIVINKDKYFDKKGKSGVKDDSTLKEYIINIYSTLMSRGIQGIYMYACNKNFHNYLIQYFEEQ